MFAKTANLALALWLACLLSACEQTSDTEEQIENLFRLRNLPANHWVEYHHLSSGEWFRKSHAGMAYDSKRGSLWVFGSDTHDEDWDNRLHEFLPNQRKWIHHGENSAKSEYRSDENNLRVAGQQLIKPWAMHTYDGVAYDRVSDSLWVIAAPDHNPMVKSIKQAKNPIWRYDLSNHKWQAIAVENTALKNMFGSAAAYDHHRQALMFCNQGLVQLNSDDYSVNNIAKSPNCLHRSLAYDSRNKALYIFGAYKRSQHVWKLIRDEMTDIALNFQELIPTGDMPLPYTKPPVAYDQQNGVFLLLIDDVDNESNPSETYIYYPNGNYYVKLPNSGAPRVGMNFMMAWSDLHQVFFLLTGNWDQGLTVWALRLDLAAINKSR